MGPGGTQKAKRICSEGSRGTDVLVFLLVPKTRSSRKLAKSTKTRGSLYSLDMFQGQDSLDDFEVVMF